jgi:glycosyltransferase involved in cell wall biosynthesis
MKLTIGIPNFNGGNNLKDAIESCQHIKLPKEDIEILIVDNQSTDDSISTIEKLDKKIGNIRLSQNSTNIGRIGNWNAVLEKAQGDYLILLFTNDKIYEKNNIKKILQILDENQTISLCISALIKREKNREKIKKEYFEDNILCDSKGFSNDSISRGLFPFGTIESIIYRIKDIKENKIQFLENLPINADEIFSYNLAIKREKILFNPIPQIIWDLTKERFHGKIKYTEEDNEHQKTIEIIKNIGKFQINSKLIKTYRILNFLKYYFTTEKAILKILKMLFKEIILKQNFVFDKILVISIFEKIFSNKDADEIIFKNLIKKWKEN